MLQDLKKRMFAAMKAGNTTEKEILRVVIGEIETIGARGEPLGEEGEQAVLRKLVKSNRETLQYATDPAQKAALEAEIAVLQSLLPKALDIDGLIAALDPVHAAVRAAGSDGQATGVAMKHLKAGGVEADGKDVGAAVKKLRAG